MQNSNNLYSGETTYSQGTDQGADYQVTEPTFEVDYSGGSVVRDRPNNILVPIGCAVTAGVLGAGLYSFVSGNSAMSQKLMRWRILAQGATVAAMTLSMPWVWGSGGDRREVEAVAESGAGSGGS
eukprot:Plantae.Rhodophyta-Hildenbrandia_rubra.ctg12947.p1 GENE.Plantae.Rhodophyta-Hildenbrandia_rubra.ctg12947~~Plantae.Rhodophyta-Hildenbrandia_rubra.ctg12947.p1  ORF type:complete len:125 (-),score=20.62 Plantae.Rhodophyta-Hildenbrandia_rubra.ctg12947:483-857(-)